MNRPRSAVQRMRDEYRAKRAALNALLESISPPPTPNQREVIEELFGREDWVTPMVIGGTNGSHHSGTLRALVRRGIVEQRRQAGWVRPSYKYRLAITESSK